MITPEGVADERKPTRSFFPPPDPRDGPRARQFFEEKTPTGEGERALPAKVSIWSFHQTDGWKCVDSPLSGDDAQQGLRAACYHDHPTFRLGSADTAVAVEVFHRKTGEFLVAFIAEQSTHLMLARNLPSLLQLLGQLQPIVDAANKSADEAKKKQDEKKPATEPQKEPHKLMPKPRKK